MNEFKKKTSFNEVVRLLNELPWERSWSYCPPEPTFTFTGEFVDTEKYDVVLKPSYIEKEITRKEEELRQVEIRHRQCEERLKQEIADLKVKRSERKLKQ